jgi:glycosyltransferase involved in cell wall biosynthesis
MKILFYNHTGQVSGAERVLLMILSQLHKELFEPLVICPADGPLKEMVAELDVPSATIEDLQARFSLRADRLTGYARSFFRVIRQLRSHVQRVRPDLLHANSIRAGLVASVATVGLGTKVVWQLHDMLPRHVLSSVIRIFACLSSRNQMIAVSHAVAKNFCGDFGSRLTGRVKVILNAIDVQAFQSNKTSKRELRRQLRLRDTDFVLGIVGQITPRKGQLELLHAFAKALETVPNLILLLVGAPIFNRDCEYLELLKRTTAELGITTNVRMLGQRHDVATVMRALDLLIVNSSAEPFGLVIPEAMACGTPVLAKSVDGIPEIITQGKNGWLLESPTQESLAEAIVYLLQRDELREQIAKQATLHVKENFSVVRYTNEIQSFYQACVPAAVKVSEVPARDTQAEAA